jgi:hypothetical protein
VSFGVEKANSVVEMCAADAGPAAEAREDAKEEERAYLEDC